MSDDDDDLDYWDFPAVFVGNCTCDHMEDEHSWGSCDQDDCECEAGWEE